MNHCAIAHRHRGAEGRLYEMTRKAVLVLGMHRSGTSALTGTLVRLGAVGPRTLIGPDAHNAAGYWESVSFNRFHERVLRSAGSSWDAWTGISPTSIDSAEAAHFGNEFRGLLEQEFGNAPLFVVKDPRICRFVPFWLRSLQALAIEPVAVLTVRPPTEVALSLAARNRLEREQSLLIWLRHMLDAEGETRTIKRSVVRYRDLLEDWKPVVDRITEDTGIEWPRRWEVPDAEIADFLKPELCHHSSRPESVGVDAPLSEWVTRTCEAFDLLLQPHGERKTEACEALDDVRRQLESGGFAVRRAVRAGGARAARTFFRARARPDRFPRTDRGGGESVPRANRADGVGAGGAADTDGRARRTDGRARCAGPQPPQREELVAIRTGRPPPSLGHPGGGEPAPGT